MLTLQQVSDRLEIEDLITEYSDAIDSREWDRLDDVFTADALIDYTAMGGPAGDPAAIKTFLAGTMPLMASYQHLVATSRIRVDGDRAEARTICFNPMVVDVGGAGHVFFCGLWYRDTFLRTPAGWRIAERREERSYFHNLPPGWGGPAR